LAVKSVWQVAEVSVVPEVKYLYHPEKAVALVMVASCQSPVVRQAVAWAMVE